MLDTVREGEDEMGFLDSLRDKISGPKDDDYYDDDYDEPPARSNDQQQGVGLLGNTRRPEAESVSVYTRSGRPVGSNGAGGNGAPSPYDNGYRQDYQRPSRPQPSPNPQYAQRPAPAANDYSGETQAIPQTPSYTPAHEGVLGNSTGGHTPADIGLKPVPRPASSGKLPPYVLKPVSYDDVQMVVRRVRTNQPVVLVFKNTNIETAKRILDFCLGLSCGIGGQVDELGDRVFVITPQGMELSDADINKLVQDGTIER